MAVRGITKVRNEAHILRDTLDNWAQWCDAIHVYCDDCTDGTAEIAREHPVVAEVIESDLQDPNRERAEWFNRRLVLHSAQRFMGPDDWICYFDGDEHMAEFDPRLLDEDHIDCIAVMSFDAYITPADAEASEWHYWKHDHVGPEYEYSPYFYRNRHRLDFYKPDQRTILMPQGATTVLSGKVRHWGKGLSVKKFEEKCTYYSEVFGPKYAAKWEARKGGAVKEDMLSDFGQVLVPWEDVLTGKVEPVWRRNLQLVS